MLPLTSLFQFPFHNSGNHKGIGICSGLDLVNPRDHDACPTAPEVPQAHNIPKMPSGLHAT